MVLSVLWVLEAELALALVEGVFERPPTSEGLDDRLRVHRGVRRDEDVIARVTGEIADHDESHPLGPRGHLPEGVDEDDAYLHGPPVGGDLDALPIEPWQPALRGRVGLRRGREADPSVPGGAQEAERRAVRQGANDRQPLRSSVVHR
jgi:hypothetical protein